MKSKNRFSELLEQLMTKADVKNYVLAQHLRYDVSYISKWVSGKNIPTEKNADKILHSISECIVSCASDKNKTFLYSDYQVDIDSDLIEAISDNLMAEYHYVRELLENDNTEIAPQVSYYNELPLHQFISKVKHPIIRQVKSLNVVAALDIFSIDPEYRIMMLELQNMQPSTRREYPGVHFSMIIHIPEHEHDYVYDSLFLMNMLTFQSNIDFQLYDSALAHGKVVFGINNLYSISGMLFDSSHCMAVNINENSENSSAICNKLNSLCNRNTLLFRKTDLQNMLLKYDYIQSILSPNLCWLIGHLTEHFLPDDLFEELLLQTYRSGEWKVDIAELHRIHSLTQNIMSTSEINIFIYASAFSDFIASGEFDFFNHRITLMPHQRALCLQHILSLLKKNENYRIKLIGNGFTNDFRHLAKPSLFLSNGVSYLRLYNKYYTNNVLVLNKANVKMMFTKFFQDTWTKPSEHIVDNPDEITRTLTQHIHSLKMLSRLEKFS